MTLIEVVLGLVVLGTLVASVALARGRAMRQYADAEAQLRAVRAAEAVLARWIDGPPEQIPLRDSGALPDLPGHTWRTRPLRHPAAARVGAVVVRFDVTAPPGTPDAERPVLSLDFVVPQHVLVPQPATRSVSP